MPSTSSDLCHVCTVIELVVDALIVASSLYSSSDTGKLFQKTFPDSEIVKAFPCGENNCAYIMCHGLRPYFLSCLQREIEQCGYLSSLFHDTRAQRDDFASVTGQATYPLSIVSTGGLRMYLSFDGPSVARRGQVCAVYQNEASQFA